MCRSHMVMSRITRDKIVYMLNFFLIFSVFFCNEIQTLHLGRKQNFAKIPPLSASCELFTSFIREAS